MCGQNPQEHHNHFLNYDFKFKAVNLMGNLLILICFLNLGKISAIFLYPDGF